jgi:cytochrome c-type biogenesis protein CcmH
MSRLCAIVLCLMLTAGAPAFAVQPDEVLPDPALEARARVLSQELRCLVCQNQSIDDSDALLARDLRLLLRERLKSGDSDQQVLDFLVARYGEFVLLRPPLGWHTVLLWLAPGLLLGAGAIVLLAAVRRRSRTSLTEPGLTPQEKASLARLDDAKIK